MQTIVTRYHSPTERRGARMSATASGGKRIYIPYPHDAHDDKKHHRAMQAMCDKMGWSGEMVNGTLNKQGHQVWVFIN